MSIDLDNSHTIDFFIFNVYYLRCLAEENEALTGFKASNSWLNGFKNRYNFSLRTKSNQGQTAPDDALEMAREFGRKVQEKATELGVTEIWNADQTPVQFEMIPIKTVDEKGTKTVWVRCAGKDKERVSVMLLASSSGRKKKPSIVFKQANPTTADASQENREVRHGFGPRVWTNFKDAVASSKCQVHAHAKAWFTGPIVASWLKFHFAFNTEPILLLLDEFTGHRTPEVLETAKQLSIRKWTEKLMEDMRNMDDFRATQASRNAWDFLSEDTIVSGFQKAYMISTPPVDHVEQSVEIPDSVANTLVEALEHLVVD